MRVHLPILEVQGSEFAAHSDLLFGVITAVAAISSVGIFLAVVFYVLYYRRGRHADRSNPPVYNHIVEIVWTTVPLAIVMGIFAWSTLLFFSFKRMPPNALEINVVGKQWMWKIQQPQGRWENNELHVPAGRPIKLVMTSEDVIHAFFIPAMRIKQDVIPGQYTQMWFQPERVGTYHLFCAEYCGTLHSKMTGTVTVMEPAEYERWLALGSYPETAAAAGERLFIRHGCSGCHGQNSPVRAPLLDGIFGRPIPVQIPKPGVPLDQIKAQVIVADQRYIHDAIVLPEQEVAAGFKPIMPTFKGQLSEEQIFQLTAYIRSLGNRSRTEERERPRSDSLTPEEYKARVGFTPANLNQITGGAAPAGGKTPAPPGQQPTSGPNQGRGTR